MVTCHAFEVQGVHVRAMPVWFVMLVGAPRGSTTVKVQVTRAVMHDNASLHLEHTSRAISCVQSA